MVTKVFKIRRRTDGLYSKGGTDPSFSKRGKVWGSPQALNSHITLVRDGLGYPGSGERLRQFYADCDIVTYEVNENLVQPVIS